MALKLHNLERLYDDSVVDSPRNESLRWDIDELKDASPRDGTDFPELRQIIRANRTSHLQQRCDLIREWGLRWSKELKFLHSIYAPHFEYKYFVEIAHSLTPDLWGTHGVSRKPYPNEEYAPISHFSTQYRTLNKIRKWCSTQGIPLFMACSQTEGVFDDEDAREEFLSSPRIEQPDDSEWW